MSIFDVLVKKPPFKPVLLAEQSGGEQIWLDYKDFYYHVHVMGLSQKGKSRLLEYILHQFLQNRVGFTLIDPHGSSLYQPVVAWLTRQGRQFLQSRTIHLFDPSDPEFCPGFNPLKVHDGEGVASRVDWFMEALSQMLGGEDTELMQRYQLVFSAFVYAAAEKGLTVSDVPMFFPRDEDGLRAWLCRGLGNPAIHTAWQIINGWNARQYDEFTGSFRNRILGITRSPVMRRVFGQKEHCLDAVRIMDQGETLLCNLEPRGDVTDRQALLLGKLLINEFTQTALSRRVAHKARPHILLIDECHKLITEDIGRVLDGTAKYDLHLVLSHQRMEQLSDLSQNIADAVMTGAQQKIFLGTNYKTAMAVVDELCAG